MTRALGEPQRATGEVHDLLNIQSSPPLPCTSTPIRENSSIFLSAKHCLQAHPSTYAEAERGAMLSDRDH